MKRLTVLFLLTVGVWASGRQASLADGMPPGTILPQPVSPSPPAQPTPAPTITPAPPSAYTRAMLLGYAAADQGDFQTALINFRRALAAKPNDAFAEVAIANMETLIAEQKAAARQREIDTLQAQLTAAVSQNDWACAAVTVDRLTTYFPASSLERARLVAYRGELTGFLESRTNVENWSTVCPGAL